MAANSVKVPPAFESVFAQAQGYVQRHFQHREDAPNRNDYLSKPVARKTLAAVISKWTGGE